MVWRLCHAVVVQLFFFARQDAVVKTWYRRANAVLSVLVDNKSQATGTYYGTFKYRNY